MKPGDVIEAANSEEHLRIKAAAENTSSRGLPDWLDVDAKALKGTFKALPQRTELSLDHQREPDHRAVFEVLKSSVPRTEDDMPQRFLKPRIVDVQNSPEPRP